MQFLQGIKEFRPKRAIRAKKAKRGKLRVSECVEVYLHTKRAKAGSIARSAVKAENGKGNGKRETGARCANSCAFSKGGADPL